MSALYTARVRAEGGRAGQVISDDGILKLNLAAPKSMGGKEDATNPEQLFAAGYAACFESSIEFAARQQGLQLQGTAVQATVALSPSAEGPFVLSVVLEVEIGGLAQADAEKLVEDAHGICPYSNATKGNISVERRTRVA